MTAYHIALLRIVRKMPSWVIRMAEAVESLERKILLGLLAIAISAGLGYAGYVGLAILGIERRLDVANQQLIDLRESRAESERRMGDAASRLEAEIRELKRDLARRR
jgi:uncharacterized protein HemX